MRRWFKSLLAWRTVRDSGVWLYKENTVTGRRKAFRYADALSAARLRLAGSGHWR